MTVDDVPVFDLSVGIRFPVSTIPSMEKFVENICMLEVAQLQSQYKQNHYPHRIKLFGKPAPQPIEASASSVWLVPGNKYPSGNWY